MSHSDTGTGRPRAGRPNIPMYWKDEGGTTSERLRKLRQERGGIVSVLTRKDHEVRELMFKNADPTEVENKISVINDTYKDFQQKNKQYKDIIGDDLDELASAAEYFQKIEERYEMLMSDFRMWKDKDINTDKYKPDIGELEDVRAEDSVSRKGSNSSSQTSSRAKAAAKKAALLVRAEAMKKRQELRRKQIELEQMDETIVLESEIAACEAEEQAYRDYSSVVSRKQIKQNELDDPYIHPHKPREQTIKLETVMTSHFPKSMEEDKDYMNSVIEQQRREIERLKIENSEEQRNKLTQNVNSAYSPQAFDMQQMLSVLQLPKTELIKYDGDPLKYWMFVRAFENSLEGIGVRNSVKLNHLFQYCTGKALEVIECCSVMEPEQGYDEARRLLFERFGNQYIISKAWVQKITEGPYIKYGDNMALQKYADAVRSCVVTLKAMGRLNEVDNQVRMSKMVEKLPPYLQNSWRKNAVRHLRLYGGYPDIDKLVDFVVMSAEEANDPVFGLNITQRDPKGKPQRNGYKKSGSNFNVKVSKDNPVTNIQPSGNRYPPCKYCSENHAIYVCDKYKALNVDKRLEFAKTNKLCFNCFSPHHMSFNCTKTSKCNINGCERKHSRLLHLGIGTRNNEETSVKSVYTEQVPHTNNIDSRIASNSMCGVNGAGASRIALPIVPVFVKGAQKDDVMTYALLDSGSTNTFCSKVLVDKLGLQGKKTTLSLSTINKESHKTETSLISLDIGDVTGRQSIHLPSVFVIPKLPDLTSNKLCQHDVEQWPHLEGIKLPLAGNEEVTLLIGQDVPMALAPIEVRRGNDNEPYATRTVFGWTLNGPLSFGTHQHVVSNHIQAEEILQSQIERFWKLDVSESLIDDVPQMSKNDRRVVDMWNDNIRQEDRHYELPIPFKDQPPPLTNNYCVAESRLENLGRKLNKNRDLFDKYKSGMDDLISKGYVEKVPVSEINSNNPVWYLPHHAVTNENKPGKVRIVFDCAAKYGGVSLNDVILQGPDLTNKLIGVLLKFREDPIAIMGDIEGMFHQVRVSPHDRDVLRFLWWRDGDVTQIPEVFRMTVHLFGGIWSPSCASFAVRRTAEDNLSDFDEATIHTVIDNFYVDDCLKSVPTVHDAVRLVEQLCELLQRGGFKINKWVSNNRQVLESIPQELRAKGVKDIDLNNSMLPSERALGVCWSTENDEFGFKIKLREKPLTRRGLISLISSVYDPIGFVCPVILQAKIIFQNECRLKKGWDEPMDDNNIVKWTNWKERLSLIEQFKVNRCIVPSDFGEIVNCQIHNFSDASEEGYGSVSYIRLVNSEDKIHCAFLMGKARLAPIKQISIPRLELLAAVVAVKVDQMLRRELTIRIDQSVFWTDSTVVLQYVQNESKRFQTFVANRITAIHAGSSPSDWRHVESKLNPADDPSRGLTAEELVQSSRWKDGPRFLWQGPSHWPSNTEVPDIPDTDNEVKKEIKVCHTSDISSQCGLTKWMERYSSWTKLKRSVAWILRLKSCLKERIQGQKSAKMSTNPLIVPEIHQAEVEIVKLIQKETYSNEIKELQKGGSVKRSSSIFRLEPMVTTDGVVCVRGRLQRAPIPKTSKHQMILPKCHHVVTLIIRYHHELLGHSGREHVLSYVRQQFWIIRARTAINKVLRECVHCRRVQGVRGSQRMADLPSDRVTPGIHPFDIVGVDCFGPFLVKRGRTYVKRYGCLFTCLSTRAVHIEKIDSMDTDSFIHALRRFESRRGKPSKIRSDNGSNFKGGNRELNEEIRKWNQEKIHDCLLQKEIIWEFNPPTASHMGGIWERQIRTVRKVLNALLTHETLDDESLLTLFCEIEAIINSRPITVVSDNPRDEEPLTPNHLLLLRSGPEFPPGTFCKQDTYLKRWKQIQFLADRFWKRWTHEYLPTLQLRQKWLSPKRNFCEGDIVLIIDENTHRRMWPLGKITKTFPGQDGLVRAVELKSRGSVMKRPVHKLCLLESVNDHYR